jgi:hypothetical protein
MCKLLTAQQSAPFEIDAIVLEAAQVEIGPTLPD